MKPAKYLRSRRRFHLAAWLLGLMIFAGRTPAANVLQTFFMSMPEDDMQESLIAIDQFAGNIGIEMQSAISIVIGTDGTLVYYDHWEDGYEEDISNPAQATSQIWGDGIPENGYPPGMTNDVLDASTVVRLESIIDVTRNSINLEYDGRDKVSVTQPVAITRALYAVDPGEVAAEAIGVYDIGSHGTKYRAPVGEGTGTGANTNEMFSYTALYIMADYDFTRVDLDKDNDGIIEETRYLDQGEPWFVNGGVKAGATVTGSQPFQCQLVTGDAGSNYEMRWFELWPESQWDTNYFSAISSRPTTTSLVFLFNPNETTITVSYVTATSSGSLTVPPDSVYSAFEMPLDSGARFYTEDGSRFIGVNVFDGAGSAQAYDWGVGLMPVRMMSTAGVVGWGPGYGTTGTGSNANPIWVATLTNTTIYVDYDDDPDTGPLVDPQGNRFNFSTNVTALQSVRLLDPNDDDQTGMRYYTLDGSVVMGAWGQDSELAQTGNPYLDMGYAIPAFPTVLSKKFASLLTDNNGNGFADSGDTIEYVVDLVNVGFATANNVIFQDDLPASLTGYVTNSAFVGLAQVPDSLPPRLTRFPFDEGGFNAGTIGLGATTTVRYVTQVLTNLPADFTGYIHNNASVSGTGGNWTGGWTVPVRVGGLSIQKQSSTTNLLVPGTNLTYTVTVANTGTVAYTGVNIQDTLPAGVTYVDGSALISLSGAVTNTVRDSFDVRSFTNSNGTVPWISAWQEAGESDGVAAGGVQVGGDVMTNSVEAYALRIGNASRSVTRHADLSGHMGAVLNFATRRVGLDAASDAVAVYISTNNWASSNLLGNVQGTANDAVYVFTNFNVSAYISTNTGIRFVSSATMGADDFIWFDKVEFILTGTNATFGGMPPPVLAQNITLPPGGSVTAAFRVQVDNPPASTQVVNQARVRADQHLLWLDSNPVTNRIAATAGITLSKTSSTTNLLAAGTNVTYTIQISNTGTIWQTGIRLEDLLPVGMTYSNTTAQLYRGFVHTNSYFDRFDSRAYTNSDGNSVWGGLWTETGDDGSETNGNIRIAVDGLSVPGQTYALRTAGTAGIQRAVNLSGYTNVLLSFDYRRSGLEADDFVNIGISSNGGSSFTQVGQIGGATNDGSYFPATYSISAYASTGTVIRFTGTANRGTNDFIWLDNIRIAASAANVTNALPPPPVLLSGYTLPAGTGMTVRLTATVDNPLAATNFINTARLLSDQQTTWITSRVTNAAAGSIGMRLTKSAALDANWDYGVTNDYYITVENTGTVALTGLKLSDALPSGVTFVSNSAAIVALTLVTTNFFTETVSDGFGTAAYTNNNGTTNWLGDWAETGDTGGATGGNVFIQTAGGTNALVFQNNDADNDYVTRTNPLAVFPGRTYTNSTLSFSWRRQNWDGTDSMTFYISTNGFAGQSNLVYTVPGAAVTDAAYSNFTFDVTSSMGTQMALRVRAGPNFRNNDRINFDFITFTNRGYDVFTNLTAVYGNGVQVNVISNLTAAPANLLNNYTLAAGTSITVRVRGTLDVPLVSTQFVNTASVTNNQTLPVSATVTNTSVANAAGDRVWFDVNGDGIQNDGASGMTGVVVRVYSAASNLLATTVSGADGAYSFSNLPAGSYFLEFVTPSNYLVTAQDLGGNDELDSDISTNSGRTAVFTLSGGMNDISRDAGYAQPVSSIGNFIWFDSNTNGVQNGGEPGVTGVVVRLYNSSSVLVAATTSTVAGAYSFSSLPPGNYFLEFAVPANYTFTLPDLGGDDALDSDVDPGTGRTPLFYLPPGLNDTGRAAGLVSPVRGLSLTKSSDAVTPLAPGAVITYTLTIGNTGTVTQTGVVIQDILPSGLTYVTNSAQLSAPGLVTSFVYDQFGAVSYTNNDGSTNWLAGWAETNDGASSPSAGAITITGGQLRFRQVAANAVVQRSVSLSGLTNAWLTYDWSVSSLEENLTVLISTNSSGSFTVLTNLTGTTGSGSVSNDISAYISSNTTIRIGNNSGTAWNAANDDGYIDNVRIAWLAQGQATNAAAPPPVMATNLTLAAGQTATVIFQAAVNSGLTGTQLLNTATAYGAIQPVIEASATNYVQSADVGVFKAVTESAPDILQIVEYILTATNNGPDAATGVKITDVLPAQLQYNSVSNGNYNPVSGLWDIGTLAAGASTSLYINVTVRENAAGVLVTNSAAVTGRDLPDPDPGNDISVAVILVEPAAIGDRVWFDSNGNGIQDAGETVGIANVPVSLLRIAGAVTTVVDSVTTDAAGFYRFDYVQPGTYRVRWDFGSVTSNGNVRITAADQGSDDSVDSDGISGGLAGYAYSGTYSLSPGSTNLSVDLGLAYAVITRASAAEVRGEWRNGRGYVVWRTDSEWDTAGFYVYRINPQTGVETRVSEEMVPSGLRPEGGRYELYDPAAQSGASVVYRLEEIELSGGRLTMGEQTVRFDPPPPVAMRSLPMAAAAPLEMALAAEVPATSEVLKVFYRKEGVYGIAITNLAAGFGLSDEKTLRLAEKGELALTAGGEPVAFTVDVPNSRILFYGQSYSGFYTRDAAVLIRRQSGAQMAQRDPGAGGGSSVFRLTRRFEEDQSIMDSFGTPLDDMYYWKYVNSSNSVSFPVDLSGYAGGPATLKVRLIGWANVDHVAEVGLNGQKIKLDAFKGQSVCESVVHVPEGFFINGTNTVTVRRVSPSNLSTFTIDWIEVQFNCRPEPSAQTVRLDAGDAGGIELPAFDRPVVLSVQDPVRPVRIADAAGEVPGNAWSAATGEEFAVAESVRIQNLVPVTATADGWFLSATNRIDYLIVVSRDMADAVQPLVDYRSAQGLRTGVAVFEDLCDLFTGGLRTPEAIRELIRHAAANWAEAPWMVLLAGNGHYDFLNGFSNERNPLPPLLYHNGSGIFAADGLFTDLDGDTVPEMAVGRLPAITTSDLAEMIKKIVNAEAAHAQSWQQQLSLVADSRENPSEYGSAAEFGADSERLAAVTGDVLTADRIYRDALALTNAQQQLRARFNEGAGIIHYTGHGNPAQMGGKTALLKAADVSAMTNSRLPVVVALSCLVGRYEAPGASLGELLMRRPNGGAVAVWGPTGPSTHHLAMILGEQFYRTLTQDGCATLGLAVLRARQSLAADPELRELAAVYNLLGDPAMKAAGLTGSGNGDATFEQWRWQQFAPAELTNSAVSGLDGDADGDGKSNFMDYAFGGGSADPGGLLEQVREQDGNWIRIRWKQRKASSGVEYRIRTTGDLLQPWNSQPPDLQVLSRKTLEDGVSEQVEAQMPMESNAIFLRIEAEKK